MSSKTTITAAFLLISTLLHAQSWQWAINPESRKNNSSDALTVDRSGNTIVSGVFSDSISFGSTLLTNTGFRSVYIAKFDSYSNLIWAKIVAHDSSVSVNDISIHASGDISITGEFYDTVFFGQTSSIQLISSGNQDVYVAKFDSMGNLRWANPIGGSGIDFAGGISADKLENTFITGDQHITTFPYSSSKVFLNKYDRLGNLIWSQLESNFGNNHFGNSLKTDSIGNCFVVGEFFNRILFNSADSIQAGNVELNGFIIKFDPAGNYIWGQKIGAASGYCGSQSLDIDQAGNCYSSGFYHGTIALGSLDLTSTPGVPYEVFVSKCDNNGNFVWANAISGSSINGGISCDNSGSIYMCGNFQQSLNIGTTTLTSHGNFDCFIARVNSAGAFDWATSYGGIQNDDVNGIISNENELYTCGTFMGNIDFGSAITLLGNDTITTTGYFAKMDMTTDIIDQEFSMNEIIFPSPADHSINISTKNPQDLNFRIYDLSSKEYPVQLTGTLINIESLPEGVYILKITNNKNISCYRKFLKVRM